SRLVSLAARARERRLLLALRRLRAGWADPDGLDVDELVDAELTQLTAVAAALHAAKGQPRIGCHDAVDEDRARLDLPSQRFSLVDVLCPDRGAQPESRSVGELDGSGYIPRPNHRCD